MYAVLLVICLLQFAVYCIYIYIHLAVNYSLCAIYKIVSLHNLSDLIVKRERERENQGGVCLDFRVMY